MKIQVKAEGHKFTIPIPTGMIFSRPVVWLALKIARKNVDKDMKYIPQSVEKHTDNALMHNPDEAVYALCDEIMRIKRKYGSWDLVEVESSSGEQVLIRL